MIKSPIDFLAGLAAFDRNSSSARCARASYLNRIFLSSAFSGSVALAEKEDRLSREKLTALLGGCRYAVTGSSDLVDIAFRFRLKAHKPSRPVAKSGNVPGIGMTPVIKVSGPVPKENVAPVIVVAAEPLPARE